MSIAKKNILRSIRKKERVRYRLKKTSNNRLRISVFRSLKYMYAQIIDDQAHHTLASCSSREFNEKTSKKEMAFKVGKELAERLLKLNKSHRNNVVFDRGQYKYHGASQKLQLGFVKVG